MTAHPHALKAWRKLSPGGVSLFRKAIVKLATDAENVRLRAMEGKRAALKLGVVTPLYSVRASREHRLMFTKDNGTIVLLDFVARGDKAYYRKER